MGKLNNLTLRILTGTALGLFLLYAVFGMPPKVFLYVLSVFFLWGAWEWTTLSSIHAPVLRSAYVILMAAAMTGASWLPIFWVLFAALAWWIIAMVFLKLYPVSRPWQASWIRAVMGVCVLIPAWYAILILRLSEQGPLLLMACFMIIICADTGAYFTGRSFGKHKILPIVSPGKTWEGWIGGLLCSWLGGLITVVYWQISWSEWAFVFSLIFFINIFAVTGDLLESMLKRHVNIKDSGRLLPGHGGILDRMDSVTAATPIFLLALLVHHYH